MPEIVRAALVQSRWTGDKQSMVEAKSPSPAEAAAEGAKVACFQELFYGPYFCQVQDPTYFDLAEPVPDGPTVELMQDLARELAMVLVVPVFEEEQAGVYLQLRLRGRRRRHLPGQVPQDPHPPGARLFREVLLPPGQPRLPRVPNRRRADRGLHLLRPSLPRGLARPGPGWGAHRVQPLGHQPQPVAVPVAPGATGGGSGQRVLRRAPSTGSGVEPLGDDDFYGGSYFVDPRGQLVGEAAPDDVSAVVVRDLDMDLLVEVRQTWAFYRDRNPAAYAPLVQP